jgi:hypothetical protein
MILNVIFAEYLGGFKIDLTFNNGEKITVDLEDTIMNESRKIFLPLRNQDYFKRFQIRLNTITWGNEADFAPEYLLELGKKQFEQKMAYR